MLLRPLLFAFGCMVFSLGFIAVLVRVVGLSCFRICLLDLVLCGVGIIYHSCALVLFCGFDTGWLSGWVDCGDVDLRWVCCVGGFGVLWAVLVRLAGYGGLGFRVVWWLFRDLRDSRVSGCVDGLLGCWV